MTPSHSGQSSLTHICIDCGALGVAGGYHDHGNGNAGDAAPISAMLEMAKRAGALADERDELREIIARAARLCEGRDTVMVLQVLREAQG